MCCNAKAQSGHLEPEKEIYAQIGRSEDASVTQILKHVLSLWFVFSINMVGFVPRTRRATVCCIVHRDNTTKY